MLFKALDLQDPYRTAESEGLAILGGSCIYVAPLNCDLERAQVGNLSQTHEGVYALWSGQKMLAFERFKMHTGVMKIVRLNTFL